MPRRRKTTRTRKVRRLVEITEDMCLYCGEWTERGRNNARRTACSPYHRLAIHRLHERGEWAPFE